MKDKRSNKANDRAAIERRKQKKAAQHPSGDKARERKFTDVANKDIFGPPKPGYIRDREARDNHRLTWE